MTATSTRTTTYTVVDVRNVVNHFAADFSMMAQATGLRSPENVARIVHDLKVFAETGYLLGVTVVLKNAQGTCLRAAEYQVSHEALGWDSHRPGNNLWPRTSGGSLQVIASLSHGWWSKPAETKRAFYRQHGLNYEWELGGDAATVRGLTRTEGQKYASNSYGWSRANYA